MKIKDLVNGFTNPLLLAAKNMSPLLGGDPTTPTEVSLMPLNESMLSERYTGKKDINQIDQYLTFWGADYINFFKDVYDGQEILKDQNTNPWKEKVPLKGSDNLYPPRPTKDVDQYAFIFDLYRYSKMQYVKEVKKPAGRKALRFGIDNSTLANSQTNPDNAVYYSDKYDGTMNLTSVMQAPMFISRLYLNGVGQGAQEQVEILDDKGNPVTFIPDTDDLFIDLESVTGAALQINFDIQTNIYLESSSLFETGSARLLPFFVLRRDEEFTESQIRQALGPLIIYESVEVWSRWLAFAFFITLLITGSVVLGLGFKVLMGKTEDGDTTDGGDDDDYYKKS